MVISVSAQTHNVNAALAVISIWCLGFVAIEAQGMIFALYQSPNLKAFWILPVDDSRIFKWQLRGFFRRTPWLLLDLVCGYWAFGFQNGVSPYFFIPVLGFGIITWLQVLSLAFLAVAHIPRFPFQLVTSAFFFTPIALYFSWRFIGSFILAILDSAAPTLNLLLPTGWPTMLFRTYFPASDWLFLILGIPIAITLLTTRKSLARIRSNFHHGEPILPEAEDLPLPEMDSDRESNTPATHSLSEIEKLIGTRLFLKRPAWPEKTLVGRYLWRWLTDRQRAIVEFAFPNGLDLMRSWKKVFRNLAITGIAALVLQVIHKVEAGYLVLAVGLFITFCQVLFITGTAGSAFHKVFCNGVNIPRYAGYSIGYKELSAVIWKIAAIQIPFMLVYFLAAASLTGHILNRPILQFLLIGMRAPGLIFFAQLMLLPFRFSAGTNDTSRISLRSLLLIPVVVVLGLAFLGLGIAGLFLPNQGIAWLLLLGAGIVASVFFQVYGLFYRSAFDLMTSLK
jgi:hypothetical protein